VRDGNKAAHWYTSQMMNSNEHYHLRGFEDLLYDAAHLLYLAHDVSPEHDTDGYEFSYIRSSILNTLLLFECGANCCIDSLNLPRAFEEDIDKLPFLSKYEFFLGRLSPQIAFDRGCREVQAAAELKAVRYSYVHPKVKKQHYSQVVDSVWDTDFGATALLKFPRNPQKWRCTHALLALKTANDFFNRLFLSWCGLDTDTVCEILLSSGAASIPARSSTAVDCIGGLDRAVRQWDIDLKFIGKDVLTSDAGRR
jgi:hypothetical protein